VVSRDSASPDAQVEELNSLIRFWCSQWVNSLKCIISKYWLNCSAVSVVKRYLMTFAWVTVNFFCFELGGIVGSAKPLSHLRTARLVTLSLSSFGETSSFMILMMRLRLN